MAKKKAEEPRGDASGGVPAELTEKQAERIRQSIELMAKTVPMKIDGLLPYQRNQKDHPEEQVRNLANSLRRFGWRQPVVIDDRNVIVIGHGRVLGAKMLGLEYAPVVRADDLTEDEIRELRIIDNKTNESSWNQYIQEDLQELTFDGFENMTFPEMAVEEASGSEWFDRKEKDGADREEGNDEYNEFLDKFEAKKTTDDCYTPENIYNAVAEWVANEYSVNREGFVRPFYPGGDYENYKYPEGCTVVDNPPFSILASIVDFYVDRGIMFFLFAPGLVALNYTGRENVCAICTYASVTYENGASVCTSFITNLGDGEIIARATPDLYKAIDEANDENERAMRKQMPKYEFPDEVLTAAKFGWLAKYGQDIRIRRDESVMIRALDAMKEIDKGIYGCALLISERAAAERAAAERAAATKWKLSEREIEIVKSLGQAEPAE